MKKNILYIICMILIIPFVFSISWEDHPVSDVLNGSDSIDVYDMDNDGDLDVVSSDNTLDIVALYTNNGEGVFSEYTVGALSGAKYSKGIDLDEDGYVDIITANDNGVSGAVRWWKNNGDQTFTEDYVSDIGSDSRSYVAVPYDLDDDGDLDVVMGGLVADNIRWYENDGSENFVSHTMASSINAPTDLFVIDLDEDGDNDVVYVYGVGVAWLENDGSETFSNVDINSTNFYSPQAVYVGDIDDDNDYDIIVADSVLEKGKVVLLTNNGGEYFAIANKSTVTSPSDLFMYDIDLDNDQDIAVIGSSKVSFLENNGAETFTQYNISSVMTQGNTIYVADIDGNGVPDIIYGDQYEIRWLSSDVNYSRYLECTRPIIFCDDFNYNTPMNDNPYNPWDIYKGTGEGFTGSNNGSLPIVLGVLNQSYAPQNFRLQLDHENTGYVPSHIIFPFDVSYPVNNIDTIVRSWYSPVFSSEFLLSLDNHSNTSMRYIAEDQQRRKVYDIEFCSNASIYYKSGTVITNLCEACLDGVNDTIKITTYFSHRNVFPFNSTVPADYISISVNDLLAGGIGSFINPNADTIFRYYIGKSSNSSFFVEDYYVYVGENPVADTAPQYLTVFPKPDNATSQVKQESDLASDLFGVWDDLGLKSTTSRILAGLFLMFLLGVVLAMAGVKTGHHVGFAAFVIIEFIFMILLTFIKLIPVWIMILTAILMAGLGSLVAKTMTNN